MNPRNGKAGSPVSPAAPALAEEADKADPGEMAQIKAEQMKNKEGKYGEEPVKAHKPTDEDEEEKSWIEIELVDEEDNPVPGERYQVTLPDGSVAEGSLDEKGFVHIGGIDPGTCQVTFPNLDKDAWDWA